MIRRAQYIFTQAFFAIRAARNLGEFGSVPMLNSLELCCDVDFMRSGGWDVKPQDDVCCEVGARSIT
jgi:hypothetical protein